MNEKGETLIDNTLDRMTVDALCEKHGLKIVVDERPHIPEGHPRRFYASLHGVKIRAGGMLVSTFSNGRSKKEAVAGLASEYTDKSLVVSAYGENRREFGPYVLIGMSETKAPVTEGTLDDSPLCLSCH